MAFTFLHTADWQLGRPFRTFDARTAAILEDERFSVIDRLAEAARAGNATDILVAGDVFDAEVLPESALRRPLDRMAAAGSLRWQLLPGNHDPARPGGIWDRLLARGLPPNVHAHVEPSVTTLRPGVALLAAPLKAKAQSTDPTAVLDRLETSAGALRIGLAHGAIQSFAGGDPGDGAPTIDPARARKARLAYLALGDWHGMIRIDDRTWYSGTPEPDRFPSNRPGFALLVTIAGEAAPPTVTPVPTARFTWARHAAAVRGIDDLARLQREIEAMAPAADRLLLKLTLTGSLSAADHAGLSGWTAALAARLRHIETDATALAIVTDDSDTAVLAGAPDLQRAADRLRLIADDAADARHATARLALARLYEFAREGAV